MKIELETTAKPPRPRLKGGKPIIISCPMSEAQRALQAEVEQRGDRLRNEDVDPGEDNVMAINTDCRKLALDARLLSATATDCPGSKINGCVPPSTHVIAQSFGGLSL